jgi:hypothetical protein
MAKLHLRRKNVGIAAIGLLGIGCVAPARAEANMFDGEWHFSVTPYAWIANVNGTASFDGPAGNVRSISTEVDFNTLLEHLKIGAMISGEARKGEWSVFTDYMYMDLGGQNSTVKDVVGPGGRPVPAVDFGTSTSVKVSIWTLAGGYSAWHSNGGHLDVFAGTRYVNMDTTADWNVGGPAGVLLGPQGSISLNRSLWDGIIGVKGEIRLGDDGKWFMPYYLDVGSGKDNTTWQALLGAGYRYGWGNVTLSMRNLSYRFTDGSKDTDVRFTGPLIGATFIF